MNKNINKSLAKNIPRAAEDDEVQSTFPPVIELENLREDNTLPKLKITELIKLQEDNHYKITFQLPELKMKADVYLLVNNEKRDMYFGIGSGNYSFLKVKILPDSKAEMFYRYGTRRSSSISINYKTVTG
ncbi:MAG TPA: hypothetical protein PK397_12375 [Ignavibacteriaceae bacterium]|nr:hypothetical protein [Ignavibacteriaceae bacterium]